MLQAGVAFEPNWTKEEEVELEWGIASKEVLEQKNLNCFCLKQKAERGRNQIGSLVIQRCASFLAQNEGLLVSDT